MEKQRAREAGTAGRTDGRTEGGRHVRCPWPTIKSSLSRKWATRRLKLEQGQARPGGGQRGERGREAGRRPLPPIFKFHLRPSSSSSVPLPLPSPSRIDFGRRRRRRRRARSFILFYWGAIDDVFQGRNLWRRGEEVKKSLFGCPQIGRTVFSILHWAMLIGRQRMLPYIGPVLEVEWVAPAP